MIRKCLAVALVAILAASAFAEAAGPEAWPADAAPLEIALEDAPALPELEPELALDPDALALDDLGLDLAAPGALGDDPPAPAANDSKPMPDYEGVSRELTLDRDMTYSLYAFDVLRVTVPSGPIQAVSASREDVVSPFYEVGGHEFSASCETPCRVKLAVRTANGKRYRLTLVFKDPYVPRALSVTRKDIPLLSGLDVDLAGIIAMKPVYARTTFRYASSDRSVAKVSAGGVVTGVGAGRATIRITAANGLKARVTVTVSPNQTGPLHARPTKDALLALAGSGWTLWPRALELRGSDRLFCQLTLLNGDSPKLTSVEGLELGVFYDNGEAETLVARAAFGRIKASCGRHRTQALTLRFPADALYCTGLRLPDLPADRLRFRLFARPVANAGGEPVAYRATEIPVSGASGDDNPSTYRALLVSEDDFYYSDAPGDYFGWEHATRNRGDVIRMRRMLGRVRTPDGSRYAVTVRHNTSRRQLVRLIRKTFADADENDVSLFFIATHGNSADDASDDMAGALVMASLSEVYPEEFPLAELRDLLLEVPGKVIVILQSCGSGAAVLANGGGPSGLRRAAEAFDSGAVRLFRTADPGVAAPVANTGELRVENKFYVLCASAYREESWGDEPETGSGDGSNLFTDWLIAGVGKSGSMPADAEYAGNRNGAVDLHELYRYISGEGERSPIYGAGGLYYQHVQVYPEEMRFAMFR